MVDPNEPVKSVLSQKHFLSLVHCVMAAKTGRYDVTQDGWANRDQIWCVIIDHVAMHIPQVKGGGGVHLHVRMHPSISYLGKGWTNCAEKLRVVRDKLAWFFTPTRGGAHRHVRMCVLLVRVSGTVGGSLLKYCVLLDPLTMCFTQQ